VPYELRIRIYGSTISLRVSRIQRHQRDALLEYCKKQEKMLKRVWYFPGDEDREFMSTLFLIEEGLVYNKVAKVFEADGVVLQDKTQIQGFLKGTLHRPKIEDVFLSGKKMSYDGSGIRWHYQSSMGLLRSTRDDVFVCYGFMDRLAVTYIFDIESPYFNEASLECRFVDCGEYGIVLSDMLYDGKALTRKVSKGSTAVHVLEIDFL
jgi:hypothetical protein